MGNPERLWYCSSCGDGPFLLDLYLACIGCGRRLGWEEETPSLYNPTLPASSTVAYSVPHTEVSQASQPTKSKPEFTSPSFAKTDFTKGATTSPKRVVDPNSLFPQYSTEPKKDASSLPSLKEADENPSSPHYQLDYGSLEDLSTLEPGPVHVREETTQRARHLAKLIVSGIRFHVDFQEGIITCTGQGHQAYHTPPQWNRYSGSSFSSSRRNGDGGGSKRGHDNGKDEQDPREGRNGGDKGPNAKRSKLTDNPDIRPLACPFFKKNRRKCARHRSCAGPGWRESHRLKEHLFRHHLIVQCPRCWETLPTTEDLEEHQQEIRPCRLSSERHAFGINQKKKTELQKRKTFSTREARWKWQFSIIFPQIPEEQIPSPYYESVDEDSDDDSVDGNLEGGVDERLFNQFRAELPVRTGEHLERRIGESIASAEDSDVRYHELKDLVNRKGFRSLLHDCILDALKEIQQRHGIRSLPQPRCPDVNATAKSKARATQNEDGNHDGFLENSVNPQEGTICDTFLWPDWALDINLSNYDAAAALNALEDVEPMQNLQCVDANSDQASLDESFRIDMFPLPDALRIPATLSHSSWQLHSTDLDTPTQPYTLTTDMPTHGPAAITQPLMEELRAPTGIEERQRATMAATWAEQAGFKPFDKDLFPQGYIENLFLDYHDGPDAPSADEE